jgi:Ca2+-binding RTX toxin-like protein
MPDTDGSESLTGGSGDDILSTLGPDVWGGVVVEDVIVTTPVDPVTAAAELAANPGPVANAILPPLSTASTSDAGAVPASAQTLAASPPSSETPGAGILIQTSTPTANNDYVVLTQGQAEVHGGDGADTLQASTFNDVLRGDDGADSLQGGSAFDDINGNKGNDTVDGGTGGSDWLVGGQGDDFVTAHHSANILYGNLGDDTLHGGDGGDVVRGGQGDDLIVGGAGNDFISGDRGNDTESGGAGADVFHGSQDAGIDHVLDFNQAEGDRVELDSGTTYTLKQVGADTVIDMGGGNQMILAGVQLSTLKDGWIFEG